MCVRDWAVLLLVSRDHPETFEHDLDVQPSKWVVPKLTSQPTPIPAASLPVGSAQLPAVPVLDRRRRLLLTYGFVLPGDGPHRRCAHLLHATHFWGMGGCQVC